MDISNTPNTSSTQALSYSFVAGAASTATISGRVTKLSVDTFPCIVTLHERISKNKVDQVLTDNDGYYTFNYVNPNFYYTILASDPEKQYNAVVQDLVRAV